MKICMILTDDKKQLFVCSDLRHSFLAGVFCSCFPVRFTTVTVRPGDFRLPLRTAGARKAPHVPADPQSAVTSEGVKKCPVKQKREGAAEFHAAAGSRSGKY